MRRDVEVVVMVWREKKTDFRGKDGDFYDRGNERLVNRNMNSVVAEWIDCSIAVE